MIDKEREEAIEQEPVELEEDQIEDVAGGAKKNIYANPGGGIKFE